MFLSAARRMVRREAIALTGLALAGLALAGTTGQALAQSEPEVFGNWTLSCAESESAAGKACEIRQILATTEDNRFVAALAIAKAGGEETMVAIVPLGVRLQDNRTIQIDDGFTTTGGRFVQCLTTGCRLLVSVTSDLINAMRSGNQVNVTVGGPSGQPFRVGFSLEGFTAAKKALDDKTS